MPSGRGLPTRRGAQGKSSASSGTRRRSRGLPLASGTALGNSSTEKSPRSTDDPEIVRSAVASSSVTTPRRSSSPSNSSAAMTSIPGRKKNKTTSNNPTDDASASRENNAPLKEEPNADGTNQEPVMLEAKFDDKGAFQVNGGKNGSSIWRIKVIVNGMPYDARKGSNGFDGSPSPVVSSAEEVDDQKSGIQYRPRRYRSYSKDDSEENSTGMLADEDRNSDQSNDHNKMPSPSMARKRTALLEQSKLPSFTKKVKGKDGNFHYCKACGEVGDVVCCDGCPHVYHPQCLPEESDSFAALDTQNDDDPWYCPECVEKRKNGTKSKKKKKRKGAFGDEMISPYRQKRPKRKCSVDAGDLVAQEAESDVFIDEDGDPVAISVCDNGHNDDAETDISEGAFSSSKTRSSSPRNFTPKKNSSEPTTASTKKKPKLKKPKASGSRLDSPVRQHPLSLATLKSEKDSASVKKKEKKKKKKKRKREGRENRNSRLIDGDDGSISKKDSKSSEDDGGGMFSHLLNNNASGLVKAVPAFYFFLNENRNKIDRNLSRKHRYFNRLPKANMERNQLIAKEGIIMWTKLNDSEVRRFVDISIKDFERRIIEWKEEKNLRNMMSGDDDKEGDSVDPDAVDRGHDLLLEDERLAQENHRRLYLGTTVGYKPYKPDLEESNNRILLELLQDTRFHPLPMIQPNRPAIEYGEMDFDRITIPYFDVNGPVSTCLGDECLGCARGWTHFCNVLKRRIPAVTRRAKLQPPLSSLVATRIGLGLKNPHLAEESIEDRENGEARIESKTTMNGGIKRSSEENVETFTSRDIPSAAAAKALPHFPWEPLNAPTERADDVVRFVEEAVCMKIPEPPRPGEDAFEGNETDKKTEKPNNVSTSMRLNLLLTGRRRTFDEFGENALEDEDGGIVVNKCGRCRTIIEGDTGCVPCRRAQLVINMSRGEGQGDESEASKLLRIQTNMLGRVVMRDGDVDSQEDGDEAVSNHILRQRWTPFAILPPSVLVAPLSSVADVSDDTDESIHDDDQEETLEETISVSGSESMDVEAYEGSEDSHLGAVDVIEMEEDSFTTTSVNDTENPHSRRLRASSRTGAMDDSTHHINSQPLKVIDERDRQELTKQFREEATLLNKRCLSVACYGMLLAMKRRDPLLHFAEPVEAEGYTDVIQEPMDFRKMKKKIVRNQYPSLGAFVSDAKLLCENAMIFNPPDSIYYKTAKELSKVVALMQKRASEWINTMKDAHAATFNNIFSTSNATEESRCEYLGGDPFERLREQWPEAVEIFENNGWLQQAVETDFMRTKENEGAYYGSLAIRRAAMAAAVSLAPYTDAGGMYNTVGRRSHEEDEKLREYIAEQVAGAVHPPELKELPSWREEMIMRVLRKAQARRMEGRMGSTHGCARCDGIRVDSESNKAHNAVTVRWGRARKKPNEVARIHKSRLPLSTGLGSQHTQDRIKEHRASDIRKGLRKGKLSALVAAADKVNEVAVTAKGSRIHGMGLFADQALQKGDVVAEYVGEYVSPAVTDAREKVYQKERIQDYQFRIDSQLVIDATKRGGHGRYANHNCDPNCVTRIIPFRLEDTKSDDEEITTNKTKKIFKRVVIVALRDIEPMEELTYDYQFPLEVDLNERIPCNCNSELCRGFMNWDLPEKGARNQVFRTQKRGANMRDRIRRLGRPLKGDK